MTTSNQEKLIEKATEIVATYLKMTKKEVAQAILNGDDTIKNCVMLSAFNLANA